MSKPSDCTSGKAKKPSGSARGSDCEQIFRLFYPRVRAWFSQHGFNRQDAEDLTQETFLKVFRKLDEFRGDCSLLTWIITIAKSLASNQLRRGHALKRRAVEEPLDGMKGQGALGMAESSPDPDPLRVAIIQEQAQQVHQAFEVLPPQQKRCFKLWADGNKYKEIAQLLEIKIDTVKSNLHLARQRIQQMCPDLIVDSEADDEEEQ